MASSGKEPIFGFNQLSMQHSRVSSVLGAMSRFFIEANHTEACCSNVVPATDAIEIARVSGSSAPLAAMSFFAFRFRSDSVKRPGPEVGQTLSLMYIRLSEPGISFQNRTLYHLPLMLILPVWPLLRDIERPRFRR